MTFSRNVEAAEKAIKKQGKIKKEQQPFPAVLFSPWRLYLPLTAVLFSSLLASKARTKHRFATRTTPPTLSRKKERKIGQVVVFAAFF